MYSAIGRVFASHTGARHRTDCGSSTVVLKRCRREDHPCHPWLSGEFKMSMKSSSGGACLNSSTLEADGGRALCLRPAWSAMRLPG